MAASMQEALKKAGFEVKNNKRVWLWLKDQANPRSAKVIAKELNLGILNVYPILSDLHYRGMIDKHGSKSSRTYSAKGLVYEVKPRTKAVPKDKPAPVAVAPAQPVQTLPARPSIGIENWSLEEAYQVYLKLHTYFGAKL